MIHRTQARDHLDEVVVDALKDDALRYGRAAGARGLDRWKHSERGQVLHCNTAYAHLTYIHRFRSNDRYWIASAMWAWVEGKAVARSAEPGPGPGGSKNVGGGDVGDGAGDFEQPVVGAGADAEALDGLFHERLRPRLGHAQVAHLPRGHVAIQDLTPSSRESTRVCKLRCLHPAENPAADVQRGAADPIAR